MWIRKSICMPEDGSVTHLIIVFARDREGATSIEYGLIASFIAISIIGAVRLIAPELIPIFDEAREGLESR